MMKGKVAITVVSLAVAVSTGLLVNNLMIPAHTIAAQTNAAAANAGTITVTGTADKKVSPDSAQVSAGVLTKAGSAANAEHENAIVMNKIVSMLKSVGIPPADIQTQWYNIQPDFAANQQTIVGFEANNNINVTIPDLNKVGTIVDALVKYGANQIDNVSYYVSNPSKIQQSLYSLALDNAHTQAESIANKLGVTITGVQSVNTSSGGVIPVSYGYSTTNGASTAVALSPGTQDISTSFSVVYTISNNG